MKIIDKIKRLFVTPRYSPTSPSFPVEENTPPEKKVMMFKMSLNLDTIKTFLQKNRRF